MEPLLIAHHLVRVIGEGDMQATLINDISLEITKGDFISISGPSGSGKSSLLYLLGLLDQPTAGSIILNNHETQSLTEDERAKLRLSTLGFVFQFHFLLPEFTALENVMMPMARLGRLSVQEQQERAESLLTDLGLKACLHKVPKQLSGGQSQRVSIARALSNKPQILLADEPTGNLDSHSSHVVQEILKDLAASQQCAVIFVTHDTAFAERAFTKVRLVDGKLLGID